MDNAAENTVSPQDSNLSGNTNAPQEGLKSETQGQEKKESAVSKTMDFMKKAGVAVADVTAPIVGFIGKSITIILTGILALNILSVWGVTSLVAVAVTAGIMWFVGSTYRDYKLRGEDSFVMQQSRLIKNSYESAKNQISSFTALNPAV